MKSRLYLTLLFLFSAEFAGAFNGLNRQEAAARLAEAVSKTNIFELPSFVMKADVQIDLGGKLVDGTYEWTACRGRNGPASQLLLVRSLIVRLDSSRAQRLTCENAATPSIRRLGSLPARPRLRILL